MSEGIPTETEGGQESAEKTEELEHLQEELKGHLSENEELVEEFESLPEEVLMGEGIQEKLMALQEKLASFKERHELITQALVGVGIVGVFVMAGAMKMTAGMSGANIGTHVFSNADLHMFFNTAGIISSLSFAGAAINGALTKVGKSIYKGKIDSITSENQ